MYRDFSSSPLRANNGSISNALMRRLPPIARRSAVTRGMPLCSIAKVVGKALCNHSSVVGQNGGSNANLSRCPNRTEPD